MNKALKKAIKEHEEILDYIGLSGYKIGEGWNTIKQALTEPTLEELKQSIIGFIDNRRTLNNEEKNRLMANDKSFNDYIIEQRLDFANTELHSVKAFISRLRDSE